MMYTSHILHQRVLNFADLSEEDREEQKLDEIHTGNCLSILIGDQLLANSSRGLAELRNPFIVEWMSKALEDFCKYSFLVEEQVDLSKPECIIKNVEGRCYFSGGSLLGYSCKSAALLAGYSQTDDKLFLNDAFDFGNNMGITFGLQDMLDSDSNANKLHNLEKLSKEETINYLKKVLEARISNCLQLVDKLPKFESTVNIRNVIVSIANKYLRQCLIESEQRL
ncbi:Decaprenyl-diphosphate synthase subunit 2-like protein [Leptotrombidium deliense]|uniref:Decaprenyl-diphosphate synthase subunit 2-like protein n=1 Tax=Leptotrombidium deliense TaxID=299467 RepID=A0A443SJ13_9ACAR|nr:Decaprenyl-diphosphate synthase subunit 2-like protein [Leptotrombidium deliense]